MSWVIRSGSHDSKLHIYPAVNPKKAVENVLMFDSLKNVSSFGSDSYDAAEF